MAFEPIRVLDATTDLEEIERLAAQGKLAHDGNALDPEGGDVDVDVTGFDEEDDEPEDEAGGEETVDLSATKAARPRTKKPKGLGRTPKKFEAAIMSLNEVPRRLDKSVNQLKVDLARDLMAGDPVTVLSAAMQKLAHYGATQVRLELSRQGADVPDDDPVVDVRASHVRLANELQEDVARHLATVHRRFSRRMLNPIQLQSVIDAEMTRRASWLCADYARRAVNEAFALGRRSEMHYLTSPVDEVIELAKMRAQKKTTTKSKAARQSSVRAGAPKRRKPITIGEVIQTAVMDRNVCEECAAVDGERAQWGSPRQIELETPYYRCLGGDNCRCVQVAVLSDNSVIEIDDGEVEFWVDGEEQDDDDW